MSAIVDNIQLLNAAITNIYSRVKDGSVIVVVDGIDGSGKSTMLNSFSNLLIGAPFRTVVLRQPYNPLLREEILYNKSLNSYVRCNMLLSDTQALSRYLNKAGYPYQNMLILMDRCVYTSMPVYNFQDMSSDMVADIYANLVNPANNYFVPDYIFITTNAPFMNKTKDGVMEKMDKNIIYDRFMNYIIYTDNNKKKSPPSLNDVILQSMGAYEAWGSPSSLSKLTNIFPIDIQPVIDDKDMAAISDLYWVSKKLVSHNPEKNRAN